ncbi:MAG: FtsK/SpoIIIE protein [Actinomycetota bacterium]|nr:FtsK/SpoIIIE protein [Actinomycetota bacterium]
MKANGTRVEDLAGTGLVTKQRWILPLWASVLALAVRSSAYGIWWLTLRTCRAWPVTVPFLAVVGSWFLAGPVTTAALITSTGATGLMWARRRPDAFSRTVGQRYRGTWRWQTRYRRLWHPAMDGTGLTRTTPERQVYVPTVTRIRSTRFVDTLDVRLLHGHTPEDVAERAEGLRHAFAAYRCSVVEDAPGRIRVLFYSRDPLRSVVPPLEPAAVPDLERLPVGVAEDGTLYTLGLVGRHVLVAGASGSGKGSVLWSLVRAMAPAIASGLVRMRGLDPKGGMELFPGRALFTHYADEHPADLVAVLEQAVEDMSVRQRRLKAEGLRKFVPSTSDPLEVVLVDELAFLTAYADKGTKLKVSAALSQLLSQGRAVGFCVVAALQDPRKEVLPFRDLFTYRIALRLTEDSHVDMVLGDGALERGAACHRIPDSFPGIGYVHVDGAVEPVRVRFSYLADQDIRDLASTWPAFGADGSTAIDLRTGSGTVIPAPRGVPKIERGGTAEAS